MQYGKMVDILAAARAAGASDITDWINEQLGECFDQWLDLQELGELTDEEYEVIKLAFEQGYGIKIPCPCQAR